MTKAVVTITGTGTTLVGYVHKNRNYYSWLATFFAYGTFGGTSVAWQWSPDNGTTKLAMKDLGGNPVASTANDSFNGQFGTGSKNSDAIQIYVTATGGSGINLQVGFYDNN